MKDLLRDDLNKEYTGKRSLQSKYLRFAYFYRYGHLPTQKILSKLFFGKSMAQKYPTYLQFGHMFKLLYFFGPFPCWVTLTCRIHLNVINITPGSTYRFKVHIQWFNFHFNILTTNAQDQCPGLMFRIYLAFFR